MKQEQLNLQHCYELGIHIARLEIETDNYKRDEKKTFYLQLASELESQNVPKEKIASLSHKIIEEALQSTTKDNTRKFTNDSWFYQVLREAKYVSALTLDEKSSDSTSGIDKNKPFSKERNQLIKLNEDIIDQARQNINLIEKDEIGSDDKRIKLDWSKFSDGEFGKVFAGICDLFYADKPEWDRIRDTRQSILPQMRLLITALTSVTTNKYLCSTFFAKVKAKIQITPKKLTQMLRDKEDLSNLFHLWKDESWKWNFCQIICPSCKEMSLKIKILENGTWVFICKNWEKHSEDQKIFQASLFADRIKQLSLNQSGLSTKFLNQNDIIVPDY